MTSVPYADLDLTASKDRRELKRRVGHALQEVCQRPGRLTVYEIHARQRCFASARPAAFAQMRRVIDHSLAQTSRPLTTARN